MINDLLVQPQQVEATIHRLCMILFGCIPSTSLPVGVLPYACEKEYRREMMVLTHEQFLDGDGKAVFRGWNE